MCVKCRSYTWGGMEGKHGLNDTHIGTVKKTVCAHVSCVTGIVSCYSLAWQKYRQQRICSPSNVSPVRILQNVGQTGALTMPTDFDTAKERLCRSW